MESASRANAEAPVTDLQRIFGERLEAVVAYGSGAAADWSRSLVLVASLTIDDLSALAVAAPGWHARGIATPLVLPRAEFARSLDAFPIEYGEIIDTHIVLVGADPFAGVHIAARDLRRALESQAASHLIHLRENFMEAGGRPAAVAALLRDSAPGFLALLRRMARMDGAAPATPTELAHWATAHAGLDARVVGDVVALATEPAPAVDPVRLFPDYLHMFETLLATIDQWPVS
jgi:hypothetical protein